MVGWIQPAETWSRTIHIEVLPQLIFDNNIINFVDDHKHLGITFSSNGQWHTHIENITIAATKMLYIMRKLKFTFSRNAFYQIYLYHLLPILKYALLVWDGCTQQDSARIVTKGGGGYTHFFFKRRLGPSIYRSPPPPQKKKKKKKKKVRKFKHLNFFWNVSNRIKYPPWPEEKTLKCIEINPKYSPILWWPPKNIHKIFIPQKYSFFWKPPKILKFKILNKKKKDPVSLEKLHN